jgi:hypothetical protein
MLGMAIQSQRPAPAVPAAKGGIGKASETFESLKRSLNEVPSWEISPNNWDKIQIAYTATGTEESARAFVKAIELPSQEIM